MKNKNYRLIVKDVGRSFFIEQNIKYFFGLFSVWDILETGTNFKSELEAERFLKQLEVKKAKLKDKSLPSHIFYYDPQKDILIDTNGNPKN